MRRRAALRRVGVSPANGLGRLAYRLFACAPQPQRIARRSIYPNAALLGDATLLVFAAVDFQPGSSKTPPLMGLFDALAKQAMGGLFGGGQHADMLGDMLKQAGGLEGMRMRFREMGLEETFMSWVSGGSHVPISTEQLKAVLGPEALQGLASKVGLDPSMILPMLGQFLPQIIDKLTPNGRIEESAPTAEHLRAALNSVFGSGFGGLFGGGKT